MALKKILIEDDIRALVVDVYRIQEILVHKTPNYYIELRLRNIDSEEYTETFDYECLMQLLDQYNYIKEQLNLSGVPDLPF